MDPFAVDTEIAVDAALERHYSVPQVAEMWNWSDTKVREVFSDEPDVLQSQLRAPFGSVLRTLPAVSRAQTPKDYP
jgi:hypothetical protein